MTLNKFLLKKYPLQVFVTKFTHPKVNNLLGRALTYKSGRKEYPFRVKDKFKKVPFSSEILFLIPLTHHTRYMPSCENSTLSTFCFFVFVFFCHACVHLCLSPPPGLTPCTKQATHINYPHQALNQYTLLTPYTKQSTH